MTETERETAGAVRSTCVAHFFAADWALAAQRASGAMERIDRALTATQLLVTAPDGPAAIALARELRQLPAAVGTRVLPVGTAQRAGRMLGVAPAHVVVGTPIALAGLLASSALDVRHVHTLLLASADEYEAQMPALGALMAELPREGARLLTAVAPTPLVEQILERYLHRARRVVAPAPQLPASAVGTGTPPTIHVRTVGALGPLAPLGELLDELDPPSAAIVVPDARTEARARTALESLGYGADSSLVRVSRNEVALHTQLVIFAGLPDAAALAAALDAHPARLVALVSARQRVALAQLAKGCVLKPFERSLGARAAREREESLRGMLRATLDDGLPAREILALEPLLDEYDGLAIAGAALRLYERAAQDAATARLAGRDEARAEAKAAKAERDAAETRIAHPRSFENPKGSFDRARSPRGRSDDRGGPRPPRRDDKPRPPRREK